MSAEYAGYAGRAGYAAFGLAHATRAGGVLTGPSCRTRRDFVDFAVDGRPLLLRLADLEEFPPTASGLLPAAVPPPPTGGRHVLYACPDCAGRPECGAVTATVERDAEGAVVWRDFAWRDGTSVATARIGPFRFHPAAYAAEPPPPPPPSRVLLLGRRPASLSRLAAALRAAGIGVDVGRDVTGTAPEELREYGVVLPDASVELPSVRREFAEAGVSPAFVGDSASPLPVLVARIEQALARGVPDPRVTALSLEAGTARLELSTACRVRVTSYRRDRLGRVRVGELFEGRLGAGTHGVGAGSVGRGWVVVVRTFGGVVVAEG
ncbi:oxidoreductase [Streptomyces sp. AV19]|uniref:oxidoreductase n=1 Tax=Streptomyces sp. AV19 TaxID=2793068 RepID=UPI0018FE77B6|nr:oxidoreductase [Streptomyces sp. AV19]MBH1938194.1 oxidoreductase [Streptomyces sp. AV19]MDG4534833.1 oxidoreductase [Streptomyces sp. AV19]